MTVNVDIPQCVAEILESKKETLSPNEVGKVLGCCGVSIRAMADAGTLGFPVLRNKSWLRIPRIPFIRWLGYDVKFVEEGENVSDAGL